MYRACAKEYKLLVLHSLNQKYTFHMFNQSITHDLSTHSPGRGGVIKQQSHTLMMRGMSIARSAVLNWMGYKRQSVGQHEKVPSGVSETSETENVWDGARQQCNLVGRKKKKKTRRIGSNHMLGLLLACEMNGWSRNQNPIQDKNKQQRWTQSRRAMRRAGKRIGRDYGVVSQFRCVCVCVCVCVRASMNQIYI